MLTWYRQWKKGRAIARHLQVLDCYEVVIRQIYPIGGTYPVVLMQCSLRMWKDRQDFIDRNTNETEVYLRGPLVFELRRRKL